MASQDRGSFPPFRPRKYRSGCSQIVSLIYDFCEALMVHRFCAEWLKTSDRIKWFGLAWSHEFLQFELGCEKETFYFHCDLCPDL